MLSRTAGAGCGHELRIQFCLDAFQVAGGLRMSGKRSPGQMSQPCSLLRLRQAVTCGWTKAQALQSLPIISWYRRVPALFTCSETSWV